jgi:hypothetical protein
MLCVCGAPHVRCVGVGPKKHLTTSVPAASGTVIVARRQAARPDAVQKAPKRTPVGHGRPLGKSRRREDGPTRALRFPGPTGGWQPGRRPPRCSGVSTARQREPSWCAVLHRSAKTALAQPSSGRRSGQATNGGRPCRPAAGRAAGPLKGQVRAEDAVAPGACLDLHGPGQRPACRPDPGASLARVLQTAPLLAPSG